MGFDALSGKETRGLQRQNPQSSRSPPPSAQKHLRCTIVGPDSSYSAFEIHICWKVLSEERMEPPIQTEYFRSGGVITRILTVDGAKAVSSLVMRSPMPVYAVVPPEHQLAKRSRRMSMSHLLMDSN